MAKLKKYQKVENYLCQLKERGDVAPPELMKLHFRDLVDLPEFEGIGERTISNILKAFKKELGVLPKGKMVSKRQLVREYLDQQMRSGAMTGEKMLALRYQDLMKKEALKGIGKTTISCALSTFKKTYEKQVFESNIMNYLSQDPPAEQTLVVAASPAVDEKTNEDRNLSHAELSVMRQMMEQFQGCGSYLSETRQLELSELKTALNYLGIDSRRIVEMYWKSKEEIVFPGINMIQSPSTRGLMLGGV
ncbi:MAG: hypothetical protein HOE30_09550 [Deltaproteobacteria bacterium]|jgi:hypothetical protein|nr:hypothetical protein [Deltaproteobacteria bacterium]MBT4265171.1 hypothetical protein [Deltaproteobacteria bacterium]MBT4638638.1 hypothetical protein [Deltaproteobacteria bacterium]MBT6503499.1 hypothetical protein [Deltaproteobacteria bacterium]MBT6611625.1 hypothetical protein [Deltaproteobacteria bacterium]